MPLVASEMLLIKEQLVCRIFFTKSGHVNDSSHVKGMCQTNNSMHMILTGELISK